MAAPCHSAVNRPRHAATQVNWVLREQCPWGECTATTQAGTTQAGTIGISMPETGTAQAGAALAGIA